VIAVVVQARMASERLPGKVLAPVAGRPLLGYLLERLALARGPDCTIVATSDEPEDDPLARFASETGVSVHRGPLADVAGRLAAVAERYEVDALVRVSGDSPLLDPALVDRALELYAEGDWELVTNVFPRSFPVGQSVEVLPRATLERVLATTTEPEDREHVTRWLYANADRFRIHNFRHERDKSGVRLAVDTAEDLQRIERIVAAMRAPHTEYGLSELLRLEGEGAAGVG
jgi:spore coat polysaccharide biosynthesis protein SpsF (cytidylyltransferase family)